MLDIAVQMCE